MYLKTSTSFFVIREVMLQDQNQLSVYLHGIIKNQTAKQEIIFHRVVRRTVVVMVVVESQCKVRSVHEGHTQTFKAFHFLNAHSMNY